MSADNVTGKNVSLTGDYSLALSGVKPSTSTDAHFVGLSYKSASNTEGYSLSSDKKSISYTPAVTEADLFTLTNVKNTDSLSVDTKKKTVTLSADNLTGKNVSITGDYSLKLGNDVPTSATKTAGSFTKFKSGTATFKTSSLSEYYSLKNNQVTYTAPGAGKTISIKNLKSSATQLLSPSRITALTKSLSKVPTYLPQNLLLSVPRMSLTLLRLTNLLNPPHLRPIGKSAAQMPA